MCVKLGYKVISVPWNYSVEKILSYNPKGVVIASGPGDPIKCGETMDTAKSLIEKNIPTLGICLGAQILGLAGGASTYKLKYGHGDRTSHALILIQASLCDKPEPWILS